MAHPQHRPDTRSRRVVSTQNVRYSFCSLAGLVLMLCLGGCGEPGSPQPPSLNLPVPVRNLTAQRTGDTIHLSWSTSDRTTDHTKTAGIVTTRICRIQGSAANGLPNTTASTPVTPGANPGVPALCERVADERNKMGVTSTYDDILPMTMTTGAPSLLTYYVELLNHAQKSAGSSNPAYAAEGADLPPLTGLTATVRSEGVLLHWDKANGPACPDCRIRIERLLKTVSTSKTARVSGPREVNPLAPSAPSPRQTLELKEQETTEALDRTAAFGQTYEYRARRTEAVSLDGHSLELLGQQSEPVTVETRDTFPPAIPKDLAAAADSGSRAIDLSWTADTEPDLAGYIVYRHIVRGDGITSDLLQRISGASPLAAPAFHDTQVQPGTKYAYSVSAVDQSGNESGRSVQAQETLAPPQ